jgi:hypothetical protein
MDTSNLEILANHIRNLESLAGQKLTDSQRRRVDAMIANAKKSVAELLPMR